MWHPEASIRKLEPDSKDLDDDLSELSIGCVFAATVILICGATPGAAQRFPDDRRGESQIPSVRAGVGASFSVQVLPPPANACRSWSWWSWTISPAEIPASRRSQGTASRVSRKYPGGSYTVRLRADEYEPGEQTVFVPPASRGRSTLILTLGARRASDEARPRSDGQGRTGREPGGTREGGEGVRQGFSRKRAPPLRAGDHSPRARTSDPSDLLRRPDAARYPARASEAPAGSSGGVRALHQPASGRCIDPVQPRVGRARTRRPPPRPTGALAGCRT